MYKNYVILIDDIPYDYKSIQTFGHLKKEKMISNETNWSVTWLVFKD